MGKYSFKKTDVLVIASWAFAIILGVIVTIFTAFGWLLNLEYALQQLGWTNIGMSAPQSAAIRYLVTADILIVGQ